jgi:hypothetical protein
VEEVFTSMIFGLVGTLALFPGGDDDSFADRQVGLPLQLNAPIPQYSTQF